ncbi:hypothetical protein OG800_23460 [Streptomyces sp. NBC_00445]|uniref:hypothetical protein n=1 Tax=Streptomyces sp. NBC_00445 TaxID=2975745 RepID=UPI002E1D5597
MDLDAVADELYGLRPEDFTAARAARVAAARTAGDRALAERIGKLRRPSLSAWASNLLVREQPEQIEPLIKLGEALRQAHQDLDGAQLRALSRQQRSLISALSRQAGQLAANAGHPLSEGAQREIDSTLHTVLADPEAAREWATGRLAKPLTATVGFPAAALSAKPRTAPAGRPRPAPAAEPRRAASARPRPASAAEPRPAPAAEPRRAPSARPRPASATEPRPAPAAQPRAAKPRTAPAKPPPSRADKQRRERLDRARKDAQDTDVELRAREKEAATATRDVDQARKLAEQLRRHMNELSAELKRTEGEYEEARAAERKAHEDLRRTERRIREARRRAETAAAKVERLVQSAPG